MTALIVVFVLYLAVVMAAGIVAAGSNKSVGSYFLGDRTIGPWAAALSSVASSESGWIVLGAVGMGYSEGASAVWLAVGCLGGYLINWYFIAPRLRKASEKHDAVTLPDLFQSLFDPGRKTVRTIAAVIIFFCMMGYVGAQFTASGKAFEVIFGFPFEYGVAIGAAITVIYTLLGGFRAVVWTDALQAVLMVIGLVIMPLVLLFSLGGPIEVLNKLENVPERSIVTITAQKDEQTLSKTIPPEGLVFGFCGKHFAFRSDCESGFRPSVKFVLDGNEAKAIEISQNSASQILTPKQPLNLAGIDFSSSEAKTLVSGQNFSDSFGGKTGIALLGLVIGLLGIGLGYPGQPHVVTRFMALKDPAKIRQARLIAIVWGVLSYYGALTLGHLARLSHPALADPEYTYPEVALSIFPPVLAGLVLAAIMAAIMSTADSQLLVAASSVTRDLWEKVLGKGLDDEKGQRRLVLISRLTILVLGGLSVLFALFMTKVVFWLVLFAWSGLGAAFGPLLIIGLWWNKVTKWGAAAGMLVGFTTTIVWHYLWASYVYELVPAFFLSAAVIVVVSLWTGTAKNQNQEN